MNVKRLPKDLRTRGMVTQRSSRKNKEISGSFEARDPPVRVRGIMAPTWSFQLSTDLMAAGMGWRSRQQSGTLTEGAIWK